MASAGDSGGRKSVGFQEVGEDDSPASEEGVPPETAAQPQPQLEGMSRTKSMKSRNHFLVHAGLEQMVAEGGHRTEQLRQEKVFRSCPATGIWSLHFPLPKPGSGKPRGYATRTLDTRTHERPERATPGTFDPFDLDNTHLTPPPTLVVPDLVDPAIPMIRVFANKFPVLTAPSEDDDGGIEGAIEVAFVDKLFPQVSAVGLHEVVVQHWKLNVCQALMTPQEVQLLWGALHERFKHLQTTSHARYVQLMENHGPRSGGSLPHAHSQLLGLPIVPGEQAQRYSVAHSYFEENEQSVFHAMIQKTLGHVGGDSDRTVLVSDGAVAMCPNAQERSHEIWILPYSKDGTAHRCSFGRATPEELGAVAEAARRVLIMLYAALDDPDYNLLLRTASAKPGKVVGRDDLLEEGQSAEDAMDRWYCWHLVIIPHGKSEQWAGIKGYGGFSGIAGTPEDHAAQLRAADGKDLLAKPKAEPEPEPEPEPEAEAEAEPEPAPEAE